jgi:hypothetical protein
MAQIKGPAEQVPIAPRAWWRAILASGSARTPRRAVLFESDRLDHACPWLFPTVVFCTVFWLNRING